MEDAKRAAQEEAARVAAEKKKEKEKKDAAAAAAKANAAAAASNAANANPPVQVSALVSAQLVALKMGRIGGRGRHRGLLCIKVVAKRGGVFGSATICKEGFFWVCNYHVIYIYTYIK